jgi:peptidoglycan/LPS O-acetylase OafA/YrhL
MTAKPPMIMNTVDRDDEVSTNDHPPYRRDIDGLRALAVISVVAFHAFPDFVHGGFIGVDIFFVISGFLISSILLKGLAQGTFSFGQFYARRIKRIFPALLLVMAACFAFAWFALFPDEFKQLGRHILAGAGFISNIALWNEVGYFDTAAETKPLLHLWSLGIEEQFYILWPVILMLAWRRRWNLLYVTASCAVLSFLINVVGISVAPQATFYSPASRAWELWLGALLASILLKPAHGRGALSKVSPNSLATIGFLLVVAALIFVNKGPRFPGWLALLPTLGATLLIAAGPHAWINRIVLSNRLMVWFGLISYPLYLWHWPLLSFAQIIESKTPTTAMRVMIIVASVLLAWLTVKFIERPMRSSQQTRIKVTLLASCMLILGVAGAYVWHGLGLPQRSAIVENSAHQKALFLVEDVANAKACKQRYGFNTLYEYCLIAQVQNDPTIALIGDSHAYHVVAGLTKIYSEKGENLVYFGTRHPYWGIEPSGDLYQAATKQMLDLALNTTSIKTVIISTAVKLHGQNDDGRELGNAVRETLKRYTSAGKQVIFMNDVPTLDFDPRACIKRAGVVSSNTKSPCAIKVADFQKTTSEHTNILHAILKDFPTVRYFDPTPFLCDTTYCYGMRDGQLLYRDTNHLSYGGDLYIGEKFSAWLIESDANVTKKSP